MEGQAPERARLRRPPFFLRTLGVSLGVRDPPPSQETTQFRGLLPMNLIQLGEPLWISGIATRDDGRVSPSSPPVIAHLPYRREIPLLNDPKHSSPGTRSSATVATLRSREDSRFVQRCESPRLIWKFINFGRSELKIGRSVHDLIQPPGIWRPVGDKKCPVSTSIARV